MKQRSENGVALVITLIMLSVITVMAVAFLAITQRERAAVASAGEYTDAQNMATAAEERAKAEIIARILSTTNWTAVDLMVSRNLINTNGFFPGLSHPTNVNYDYTFGGGPLSRDDLLQNLTNLWIDPRVPVFINTNRAGTQGDLDFRFYVDLNRNGRFDTNGFFVAHDDLGNPIPGAEYFHVGDLEWIGVLERPHLPHSSSNRFFGRYAYVVVPVGKTLDLNFIHNDAKQFMGRQAPPNDNGFYRNQGFGSWEINLAAFLGHLNTNQWPIDPALPNAYFYDTNLNAFSGGWAFSDATDLLRFRYNGRPQNLYPADFLLQPAVWTGFRSDGIDAYALSPNPPHGQELGVDLDDERLPWPGASSTPTNHFFSIHDFFRLPNAAGATYNGFLNRLAAATSRNNTYDSETLYRLLAQLGTDSAPEPQEAELGALAAKLGANNPNGFPSEPIGRININWDNIRDDNPANRLSPLARHWDPLKFFTNTANVLLRSQFPFGATNIPVYPTNWYTAEVHRLLQLAANLYDATTTNWYPSVFRPVVTQQPGGGYEITTFTYDADESTIQDFLSVNTFGLPMIIGAKKGIPNFNEFAVQSVALAARKLELRRDRTNAPANYITNQMFVLGVSNAFAVEAWNSYSNVVSSNLPVADLNMTVGNVVGLTITNSDGLYYSTNYVFSAVTNIIAQLWGGFQVRKVSGGFVLPIATNVVLLTNSAYLSNPPRFIPVAFDVFDRGQGFPVPEWMMTLSNRLTYILASGGRILDFVYLDQITNTVNLSEKLMELNPDVAQLDGSIVANCWRTNRLNGAPPSASTVPTEGVINQLEISVGNLTPSPSDWNNFNFGQPLNPLQVQAEIQSFRSFLGLSSSVNNTNLVVQTPFNPARKIVQTAIWGANDPLVHHRIEHLKDNSNNVSTVFIRPFFAPVNLGTNINGLNARYRPWGGRPGNPGHPNDVNHAVKDPGVASSDDWDFPTNKFPSVGWMGRVHRGTPWQTVYLKAEGADGRAWEQQFFDPLLQSHPTNDWRLIDMFTVAAHPNATRGQLSINQTNIAAWAAVLSGVFVLTNLSTDSQVNAAWMNRFGGLRSNLVDMVIEPNSGALSYIVDGINRVRNRMPGQTFRRLGDILQVPELSIGYHYDTNGLAVAPAAWSPYLLRDIDDNVYYGLNDVAYERIPQQILSLLKVGDPRYVIYSFGQSLKPAEQSIITSGGAPYTGLCTNYQITGEVVTRSVVRLEGAISRPKAVIEAFNVLPVD